MTHFLKYVAARLFIGTFAAVFTVYWSLAWLHEVVYAGQAVEDWRFAVGIYAATLTAVSLGMSLWGRWRAGSLLERQLERLRREYHPKILVQAYRRLIRYLESCYFFNTTRRKLSRNIATRFGEILLGMRIEDDEALAIYESILLDEPEQGKIYDFLIQAYSRRGRLSDKSFNFLRRRFHERPDDRLVGILAREYTLRGTLNFESERVLLRAIRLYPRHQAKILRFVVPKVMAYRRTDDNAAQFYLAAAESGFDQEVGPMLHELDRRYQAKGRDDALAFRLARVLHEHDVPTESPPSADSTTAAEKEDADSFTLEGLGYGDESLERQPEADEGRLAHLSFDSRLHALAQKMFAGAGGTVGRITIWLKYIVLILLVALAVWLARPLVDRLSSTFRGREKETTGPVVEGLPVAGDSGTTAPESAPAGKYSLQVGAFSDSSRAVEYGKSLGAGGLETHIAPGAAGSRRIYRVRVGRFASEAAAERAGRLLMNQRLIEEWQVVEEER